jgi:hypothetical protein
MVKNKLLTLCLRIPNGHQAILPATSPGSLQQRRSMVRIENFVLPQDYPDPWPYKERGFVLVFSIYHFFSRI